MQPEIHKNENYLLKKCVIELKSAAITGPSSIFSKEVKINSP
jgi:hypothetical protein